MNDDGDDEADLIEGDDGENDFDEKIIDIYDA